MHEKFLGEALKPITATCHTTQMAAGAPGLPGEFLWGKDTLHILNIVRAWRETGKCTHGSGENYVRKHWFEVESSAGTARIYFERKSRGGPRSARWWLYSILESASLPQVQHQPTA